MCRPIWRRVLTDPPTSHRARRSRTVRAPPRGHRISTYPRPPRPRRRVLIVCVPPIWRRVLTDPPTGHRARRSRTVRAPPRGHRISTYPWPPRPRRRVLIVCVPPIWRRGPAPQQDRPRAVQDPVLASPDSHVTPPAPPAPDCSRRDATGTDPRPTSITDTPAPDLYSPAFTAQEVQLLAHTDHGPPLAAEVRLLQVLILRLVTTPRRRRRRAGAAFQRRRRTARQNALHAVCRAMDVLQRMLKTQLSPRAERLDGVDAVTR